MTATLSVAAAQLRLIWVEPAAVAWSVAGAVGGVVSGGGAPPIGVAMSVWICACVKAEL